MRRSSSQGAALALAAKTAEAMTTAPGQWGKCADVGRSPGQRTVLAVAAKARGVMKVYHVLADPREETREMSLDPEKETWKVSLDFEKETREVPLDSEEETREMPLDSE